MSIRPLLATTFVVAGLLSAQEAAPQPAEFTVETGTKVPLSLINSVSTKHSAEGDRVYLETVFPVLVNGRIVVPVGSYVAGTVTQLKKPGRVKGRGELYVRFDSLTLPNGVTRDFHGRIGSMDGNAKDELDRAEGKVRSEGNKSGDARTVGEAAAAGASIGTIAGGAAGHYGMGAGIGAAAGAAAGMIGVLSVARSGRGAGARKHARNGARPADQLHGKRIEFRQLPAAARRPRRRAGRLRRDTRRYRCRGGGRKGHSQVFGLQPSLFRYLRKDPDPSSSESWNENGESAHPSFFMICADPLCAQDATRSASARQKRGGPSPKATNSCGNIEYCIRRIGRQLAMRDPVEDNLSRGRLCSLKRVLLRGPVQEDVQFGHFGDPTAVDFAVELDRGAS